MVTPYRGGCHCGSLTFSYATDLDPGDWSVRACECSFCRAHGARTTSDPSGNVRFEPAAAGALTRYSFGLRTAEFLVCAKCGVYVAALLSTEKGSFATINVNALIEAPPVAEATPTTYEGESREERISRREQRWTPVGL